MLELTSILILLALSFTLITFRTVYRAYATPFQDVPGPLLARFTRLWLTKAIYSRKYHKINTEIHRKYGPIVRIAPNEYSIDDPDAAQAIYRSRDQLSKVRYTTSPGVSATTCCIVLWRADSFLQDTWHGFNQSSIGLRDTVSRHAHVG